MSVSVGVRPVIDRTDVRTAFVEEVIAGDAPRQRAAAAALVSHWRPDRWPAGLQSLNCFISTDGNSLLTYSQWASAAALDEALRREESILRPDWEALGVRPGQPAAYELYRVVRPLKLPDPMPVTGCYPAAVFAMNGHEAAREWIDGLLGSEEETEGEERAYPGALAAHFHVASDGTGVFLLSEWASEPEAAAHITEVIEPLLEHMGQGGPERAPVTASTRGCPRRSGAEEPEMRPA
ncbi:hypothetical protein [Streptomyces sp. CNQ085]|uniref:hypothetical protein n=1 Tax=Streptomyces sp. CNQ085 TaxID=2886944 RepID=UPI001F51164A|nr:hypothetical protein [Streptomyces sp. CNQ085]MCI0386084.1 hypothetical protein [Streptomyces sp. CNQ085]